MTALTGLAGVGIASAQSNPDSTQGIVEKIASKFNLNKDDVQKIFDEDRAEHEANREAKMQERLDIAVSEGKLTQDQADKLLAKQKEMKTFMESLKDKTAEERRSAMDAKRDEFKQWLKDNNIPDEFARQPRGGGPGGPPPEAAQVQ